MFRFLFSLGRDCDGVKHDFRRMSDIDELNELDRRNLVRSEVIDSHRARFNHVYECSCGRVELRTFISGWDL